MEDIFKNVVYQTVDGTQVLLENTIEVIDYTTFISLVTNILQNSFLPIEIHFGLEQVKGG